MEISKKSKYQWNPSWADRIAHDLDINKAIEEIEIIKEINGEITPQSLVDSAQNKQSVFHSFFEWDDQKAANAFRKRRASEILAHVEVKIIKDDKPFFVRAFEVLNKDHNNFSGKVKYVSFDALASKENFPLIKKMIITDLGRISKKLKSFSLDNIAEHLDNVIKELTEDTTETKKPESPLAAVV